MCCFFTLYPIKECLLNRIRYVKFNGYKLYKIKTIKSNKARIILNNIIKAVTQLNFHILYDHNNSSIDIIIINEHKSNRSYYFHYLNQSVVCCFLSAVSLLTCLYSMCRLCILLYIWFVRLYRSLNRCIVSTSVPDHLSSTSMK